MSVGISLGPDLEWQKRGLCARKFPSPDERREHGDRYYPQGRAGRDLKERCKECPVRAECLDYALLHDERYGIWGGLSAAERAQLSREAVA